MAVVVRMPSVLAGATEAALAHWLVAPGDTVSVGTPLAELETEKALVEYAAEESGAVGRLLVGEGDSIEVGDPIAVLVAPGETEADIEAALGGSAPAASQNPAPAAAHAAPAEGAAPANGHQAGRGGRVFASPLVRKLAGQRGVDLAGLAGTGPNGRIVRRDLERFLAVAGASAAPASPGPAAADPAAGVAGRREAEHAPVLADGGVTPVTGSAAAAPAGATLIP